MPITLKNITAADTLSSMVDKINFNFDQLILNGGGIEGPRGIKGYPGAEGLQGERGLEGQKGDTGERGTYFHFLDRSDIDNALNDGLGEFNEQNGEYVDSDKVAYKDGDIIIAKIIKPSNGEDKDFTDSLWSVKWDNNKNKFIPSYICEFHSTDFFEEIRPEGSSRSLLRTSDNGNERGLVLNDYKGNLNKISSNTIDDVVDHNIALVYNTTDSNGSPNGGIVFYHDEITEIDNNSPSLIGNFPRINYVISPDSPNETIKQLNIFAPEQDISICAENDIKIHANKKTLSCRINDNVETGFEVYKYDENSSEIIRYLSIKNIQNKKSEIHLASDEIFFENYESDSGSGSASTWIKIRNKNYIDENTCEIELAKANTFVNVNNAVSIGKIDLSATDLSTSSPDSTDNIYAQANILLKQSETYIIADRIQIGKAPNSTAINAFGMYITPTENIIKIKNNFAKIKLNTDKKNSSKITLETKYPGVVDISNVSECFDACIINYTDDLTDLESTKFFTAPMKDNIYSVGKYNYANMNCYNAMCIRNIKNMGAVHAGTVEYIGDPDKKERLIYNFTRVGNVVQCTFSGVINTSKICAINDSTGIRYQEIQFGESLFKSTGEVTTKWNNSNATSGGSTSGYTQGDNNTVNTVGKSYINSNSTYIDGGSITPNIVISISPNRLYLYLYPPVINITSSENSTYKTNVKNLIGHLTYSSNGSIYEKSLSYDDNIDGSNNEYRLPAITVSNMEGSSTTKTISGNSSTVSTLPGSSDNTYIEISGHFSYVLDVQNTHHVGTKELVADTSGSYAEYSGNGSDSAITVR